MNRFYRYCIALFASVFVSLNLHGQGDKAVLDSIKASVQTLSSDTLKVSTLLDISKSTDCDDSGKKLATAMEAQRIAEKVNWVNGISNSNSIIGDFYFKCRKNYVKAFEFYDANVELAKKRNDKQALANAYDNIAKQYGLKRDHLRSIEYYNKELELKLGISFEATIYANIGITYKSIGDESNAIIFYDSSLNLLKSKKTRDLQDTFEIAALLLNKAEIYLNVGEPDKALHHYEDVLKISTQGKNDQFKVWALTGFGKAYKGKKDYSRAIDNYQKALEVCNRLNAFADEVTIFEELAATYMETWDLKKASDFADSALSLAERQHFINLLSKCNATLGNIYVRQEKYEVAISYLQKALSIAQQTHSLEDQKEAWEGLYNAYKRSGDYQLADNAHSYYYALRDSVYNVQEANRVTKALVESEQKVKAEIERLKQDAIYSRRDERQKILIYSGFAALVLVVLLAFFMFRNYKTQKKYNELLSREKLRHLAHIEAQSNILSDIAHTQAHQIRGPISTILGLVNIFNYDDPADPMNKQVMEWITSTTEKLDAVVKDVIIKENELRSEHDAESEAESNGNMQ